MIILIYQGRYFILLFSIKKLFQYGTRIAAAQGGHANCYLNYNQRVIKQTVRGALNPAGFYVYFTMHEYVYL